MPVQSEKQRRFMYASLAGKTDVPPSVAKKFVGPKAHKAEGGTVKESKAMREKEVSFMKKKGAPKSMIKHEMAEAKGYANGGRATFPAVKGSAVKSGLDAGNKSADGIAQRGKTRGDNIVMKAKGGSCYARGGGAEAKGKTRGHFV
jgi:hypothetical protein